MRDLKITLWNDNQQPLIQQSFVGEWLIAPSEERGASDSDCETGPWNGNYCYAVARTQKGAFAVYTFTPGGSAEPFFRVYCDTWSGGSIHRNFRRHRSDLPTHRNLLALF